MRTFVFFVALSCAVGCSDAPQTSTCKCPPGETCVEGTCRPVCDPAAGCTPCESNIDCDDSNPCTDEACVLGACQTTFNSNTCDDGVACTEGDTCREGACLGTPNDGGCDDGNVCTDERCDAEAGCIYESNTAPCDDDVACTEADTCREGACGGTPNDALCDDLNVCTEDRCDAIADCQHEPVDATCDDANPCTANDACVAGACRGDAAAANFTTCEGDGDPYTWPELCYAGQCLIGTYADPPLGELGCSCGDCGQWTAAGLTHDASGLRAALNVQFSTNPSTCESGTLALTGVYGVSGDTLTLIGAHTEGTAADIVRTFVAGAAPGGSLLGIVSGDEVLWSATAVHDGLTSLGATRLGALDAVCLGALPCSDATDVWLAGTLDTGDLFVSHCTRSGCGPNLISDQVDPDPVGLVVFTRSADCVEPCTSEVTYYRAMLATYDETNTRLRPFSDVDGDETMRENTGYTSARLHGAVAMDEGLVLIFGEQSMLFSCRHYEATSSWVCVPLPIDFSGSGHTVHFYDGARSPSGEVLLVGVDDYADYTWNVLYVLPRGADYASESAWKRYNLLGGRPHYLCGSGSQCDTRLVRHIAVTENRIIIIGDNLTNDTITLWRFAPAP